MKVARSSGLITVGQSPHVVSTKKSILVAVHVFTDGINDATVTVYDSDTGANGTVLAKYIVKGTERQLGEGGIWAIAINGLAVSLSGAGSSALIRYVDYSPGT